MTSGISGVQSLTVAGEDADIRLDRWFRRHFPDLSHGRLEKLLRKGQVRVDGSRARSATRLAEGQTVRVPPLRPPSPARPRRDAQPAQPAADRADLARVRDLVIYRDDEVIAINKPPGLAVQGGSGVKRHLDAMLDGLRFGARERPRLVHRLDKDTSGVLLLGRTARATARLAEAFRGRAADKTYWALVVGVPKPRSGRISLNLAKRGAAGVERMTPVEDGGKTAVTYYAVLETAGRKAAWVALRPLTGRTHQIRVHCAAIGTPIIGDGKYGGAQAYPAGVPDLAGLHLHARSITLPHPSTGALEVVAELPPDMIRTWRFFGFVPGDAADPFADLTGAKG